MTPRLETMLIYGKSGMTKTTQLYHIVKYLHGLYPEKVFRLVTTELGNNLAPFEDSGMIDEKIVEVFDLSGRPKAFADVHRVGKGYWPRKMNNGDIYFESDDKCLTKPDKWAKIGGYLFEGLTSLANMWLHHSSDQIQYEGGNINKVKTMGYAPSFSFVEDDLTITGSQPAHYGIVQKEIYRFYMRLSSLPINNGFLVCTALEGRGDEDMTLKRDNNFIPTSPIYGPKLVGTAYTSIVPSWFRHTIHMDLHKLKDKEDKTVEKIVGWFVNHANYDTGINYIAKPRILPEIFPKLMERFSGGYCQIGFKRGIDKYIEVLDELRKEFRSGTASATT